MSNLPRIKQYAKKRDRQHDHNWILAKGDLAPPHLPLMSINNPGGISLNFFAESPFSFTRSALADLHGNHYEDAPEQHILRRSSATDPWIIDSTTIPTSDRYAKLIPSLLAAKVISPLSHLQGIADTSGILDLVVLRLFAVVKDLPPTATCRPIENGRPVRSPYYRSNFSLPGGKKLTQIFLMTDTRSWTALHGDLQNYYFQIPLSAKGSFQHAFVADQRIYLWLVLTMGWYKATRIAESFCIDLCLRNCTDLLDNISAPDGLIIFKNQQGLLVVIYDSFLVLGPPRICARIKPNIEENCRSANVKIKYLNLAGLGEAFEFCGFELTPHREGILWRIAPSTVNAWVSQMTNPIPPTLRSLWSLGGILTFAHTVRVKDRQELYKFRQLQADSGLIEQDLWDVENRSLEHLLVEMISTVRKLEAENTTLLSKSLFMRDHRKVIYAAFDATPLRWAFSVFHKNLVGTLQPEDHSGVFPEEKVICAAECFAAVECIQHVLNIAHGSFILILVGDNQTTLRALAKRASGSPDIQAELARSGLEHVDHDKRTIVCTDIDTSSNYADLGTRPDNPTSESEISKRYSDTCTRFLESVEIYRATRQTYISREKTSVRNCM